MLQTPFPKLSACVIASAMRELFSGCDGETVDDNIDIVGDIAVQSDLFIQS